MTARRTAFAGGLMVATRLGTRLLDLASLLVLARLLSPADFGLVAIAGGIVAVAEAALELPLNQALLRLETIEPHHHDTAFTLGALRCAVLYGLLLLAMWPLGIWFDDARLLPLVLVLGFGALSRGMVNPRLAEFQKTLSFWRDVSMEVTGKVVGAGIGISLAVLTHSYWSVAVASIAAPTATLIVSYALAPYRPRCSLASVHLFSASLGWLSLAQIISTATWQSERLLLGRFIPVARLGLFTTASDLSLIPFQAVFGPLLRPLLAAFHAVRHDEVRLARSYRMATRAVMALGLPILVGESLLAEPIVRVILGERWLGIAPLLRWLAPSLIPGLFVLPAVSLVTAFGETRDLAARNAIEIAAKLPMLWLAYSAFGLGGVALSRVASEAVAAYFCMRVVRRMVGLPMRRQLSDAWPCLVATAVMALAVLCLRASAALEHAPIADLGVSVAGGAMVYFGVLSGLWHLTGRPDGVEAVAAGLLTALRDRAGQGMGRPVGTPRTR